MKLGIIFTLLLIRMPAIAMDSAHAHANEIPGVTLWQLINLSILMGALIYLLKDSVKKQFADKKTNYLAEAEKSRSAQQEAEKVYVEIKRKLEDFNKTIETSLARARNEAQQVGLQMVADAKVQAKKIKDDADSSVRNEGLRAQRRLHGQAVSEVIGMARAVLMKDIGSSDHQRLQNDFSKNIQTVSP